MNPGGAGGPVAPFESCVACLKGDTTTGLALRGEGESVVAGLMRLGLPYDEALATLQEFLHERGWIGADDELPSGDMTHPLRVCQECAEKAGMSVGELPQIPIYSPKGCDA